MAKKKTRRLGECRTVGQLIKDLKKNFDQEDAISIITLLTIDKGAKLDLVHNQTIDNSSHINNIGYSLQSIENYRKECEEKDSQE